MNDPNALPVAKTGDRLVTIESGDSGVCGFALVGRPGEAIRLLPDTTLEFDKEIRHFHRFSRLRFRIGHKTARFRHFPRDANANNDALELADGRLIMLTELAAEQTATVMKVPPLPPSASA